MTEEKQKVLLTSFFDEDECENNCYDDVSSIRTSTHISIFIMWTSLELRKGTKLMFAHGKSPLEFDSFSIQFCFSDAR